MSLHVGNRYAARAAARLRWWQGFPERTLAGAVRLLLGLVLLTPLVVGQEVIYPFVVGKALYSRVLIALAFAAWAVLALARPAWRPPRAGLLVLVGVGVLAATVAAAFGVSRLRSFWSYYGRMEGLFDLVHWAAFAVMAASMFQSRRDWAWVAGIRLAVGLAVAVAAHAQALGPPRPEARRRSSACGCSTRSPAAALWRSQWARGWTTGALASAHSRSDRCSAGGPATTSRGRGGASRRTSPAISPARAP